MGATAVVTILTQGVVVQWLKPAPAVLVRVETDSLAVALTIDDAPSPEVTPGMLEVLRRHGVRATFFVSLLVMAGTWLSYTRTYSRAVLLLFVLRRLRARRPAVAA